MSIKKSDMGDNFQLDAITVGFCDRLREAVGALSVNAFAKKSDVPESLLRKYLAGDSLPGMEKLIGMAVAADVRLEWLAEGAGPKSRQEIRLPDTIPSEYAARLASGDYAFIPLYDVRAAAGAGAVVDTEEIVDFLVLSRIWIRQQLGADPSFLSFLYVDGDSMEPLLRPNEMILVDRSAANAPVSGVYVIRLDGNLLVKRVMRCPGNVFIVKSENEAYRAGDFTVEPGDGKDFAVVGRVVWAGKSL